MSTDAQAPDKKRKVIVALVVALTIASALFAQFHIADDAAQGHVDSAFKRALVAFALARGLNGVISVAQGTEVAFQPAGVGINFTPGEVLDPINDLVERFSWIMMLASSSLGIQKILLSMSAWQGLLIAVGLCAAAVTATYFVQALAPFKRIAGRLFILLIALRFMMPAISIANNWVYEVFLEADYQEASQQLDESRNAIGEINTLMIPSDTEAPSGIIDRARQAYNNALDQVDIEKRLDEYRVAAENISESAIRLIVVFLMQTVVFPLLFLFIVVQVVRRVMSNRHVMPFHVLQTKD